jgi:hypothetical protein
MRSLSALELLDIWERGRLQNNLRRALLLLAAAQPESSVDEIAEWSIGERNAALLQLRERTFGGELASRVTCPQCGTALEVAQDTRALLAVAPAERAERHELRVNGYNLRYRLPNTNDLLAVAVEPDPAAAQMLLLERILDAPNPLGELAASPHAFSIVEQVDVAISEADPLASIQFDMTCPQCGNQWTPALDIGEYFWTEIHAWVLRTVHEVHVIATAYGWTEDEILALSPQRRQLYLEMIGS